MVCYGHGILGVVDISLVCIRHVEGDVNQGSGVSGGRALEMLIFHWLYNNMEQTLDHHGIIELDIVDCSFGFLIVLEHLEQALSNSRQIPKPMYTGHGEA